MIGQDAIERACASVRARWDHPPLDARDVAERVAARLGDAGLEMLVLPHRCACRIFLRASESAKWVSRYVHALGDVDGVLDHLLARIAPIGGAT
ncbi:hypothetical protein [Sandaracinus amylolyticus]|uniref:Uncharacterized protein n=1 Tax=Sandaracinus amylolyticus TaxID=927083 RepID=A0A0F6W2W3_9BACT|nr:hypothetical protein [Sandaracinus amylolyticus]AKF06062.1 hypothetical protein DB32_003211 [Sandaracinus amylolyticus]